MRSVKTLFFLQGAGCVFEETSVSQPVNRLFFHPSRRNESFRPTEYYIFQHTNNMSLSFCQLLMRRRIGFSSLAIIYHV